MTPEERQMLAGLFERINANSGTPRDAQAEAFINDAVRAAPHAPYVLSQTVLVQQHALEAAAQRIAELEAAAREAASQSQEQGSFLGNLGKSIFGGGAPSQPPRQGYDASAFQRGPGPAPGPAYAPPPPQQPAYGAPQPGPWSAPAQGGGGFLQQAASTAAGVAGGVALGNLLGGLFGGHSGGGLFGGGGGRLAGRRRDDQQLLRGRARRQRLRPDRAERAGRRGLPRRFVLRRRVERRRLRRRLRRGDEVAERDDGRRRPASAREGRGFCDVRLRPIAKSCPPPPRSADWPRPSRN